MKRHAVVVVAMVLGLAASAWADGIVIPIRPDVPVARAFTIKYHHVDVKIVGQMATVAVDQIFANPGKDDLEVQYVFPLPEEAAVSKFSLIVDGQVVKGELMSRDEARRVYESIVRAKKDPALLEYMGRGMFRTSAFPIPAGKERQVKVTYQQLLRKDGDLVELVYPLNTEKFSAVKLASVKIDVQIEAEGEIRSVYSPSHPVAVQRPAAKRALAVYQDKDVLPDTDFRLFFQVSDRDVGGSILTYRPNEKEDGYFLMLASPRLLDEKLKPLPKTLIVVLDKSGSMNGRKLEQAVGSLKFILTHLNEGDLFNVLTYDSGVTQFAPELQDARAVNDAVKFADAIRAGGSTNIDSALAAAFAQIKDDGRPGYIIFLTDGLPTAGVTDERTIVANAASANARHARLFTFGVGNDVNTHLLDKLSLGHRGVSEYVAPQEDIERAISGFYRKVSSPIMTDLALDFGGVGAAQMYPENLGDLFAETQLVLVGRYTTPGQPTVKLTGQFLGQKKTIEYPADFVKISETPQNSFVEKLWAVRRVGYIIEQIQLQGSNQELVDELVALSTKHGILTEYTAFLAREDINLADARGNSAMTGSNVSSGLSMKVGAEAVNQARSKQAYQYTTNAAPSEVLKGNSNLATQAAGPTLGGVVTSQGVRIDTTNVRYVGDKVFFLKNGVWTDSTVTEAMAAKAVRLARYGDDFFKQVNTQSATQNHYFSQTGKVMVNLAGQTYLIE